MTEDFQIAENRECGSCSMCCTIIGIDELNMAPDVWCQHCKPGHGCTIYDQRPEVCRDYMCLWLYQVAIPDWMKPSESRIILDAALYKKVNADGNEVELQQVRACVAAGFRHVIEPGTKQREFLDS